MHSSFASLKMTTQTYVAHFRGTPLVGFPRVVLLAVDIGMVF